MRYARRIDGFLEHEALAALDYCRRNIRCCWTYLNLDRERNPNPATHEYSIWKLQDARKDLRRMIKIVRAFKEPHLKLVGDKNG